MSHIRIWLQDNLDKLEKDLYLYGITGVQVLINKKNNIQKLKPDEIVIVKGNNKMGIKKGEPIMGTNDKDKTFKKGTEFWIKLKVIDDSGGDNGPFGRNDDRMCENSLSQILFTEEELRLATETSELKFEKDLSSMEERIKLAEDLLVSNEAIGTSLIDKKTRIKGRDNYLKQYRNKPESMCGKES